VVTSNCTITLKEGIERTGYGNCVIGEMLHDDTQILSLGEAMNLSRARALRNGLRMVGFDPLREHQLAKDGGTAVQFTDQRNKQLAEAHMLGEELGYIVGDNKVAWHNQIRNYFSPKTSAAELNELELSQWLSMLRAWKSARACGFSAQRCFNRSDNHLTQTKKGDAALSVQRRPSIPAQLRMLPSCQILQ
jgi:hypothetical protein